MIARRCIVAVLVAACVWCLGAVALAYPPQGPVPHRIWINDSTTITWCDNVSVACLPRVQRNP
jgi:hypothetical protein